MDGAQGQTGPAGKAGADGADGEPGAPGLDAPPCKDGEPGAAGEPGIAGPPGPQGVPGKDGAEGPRGARGKTGRVDTTEVQVIQATLNDYSVSITNLEQTCVSIRQDFTSLSTRINVTMSSQSNMLMQTVNNQFVEINQNIQNVENKITTINVQNTQVNTAVTNLRQEMNVNLTQVTQQIANVEMTVIQEAGDMMHVAILNHTAGDAPCCEDCNQAKFRVPPETECKKMGCAKDTCAYQNTTCDAAGNPRDQCLFPFTYQGKVRNTCIDLSDHGETKRPWCYLDTPTNRGKGSA